MFHVACLTVQKLALICLILFALLYLRLDYKVQTETATVYTNKLSPDDKNNKIVANSLKKKQTFEILSAMDPTIFEAQVRLDLSHPLENSCKYPVLSPNDPNIGDYVQHVRYLTCKQVLPDIVSLLEGVLYINQPQVFKLYNQSATCWYRPFAGSLRPNQMDIIYYEAWKSFSYRSDKIYHDQFEVKCALSNVKDSLVYRNAFAQVTNRTEFVNPENPKDFIKYAKNDETTLSVDIIGLDSTSLNMFRRHMPRSWDYFIKSMGAYRMEGYNKVADNSMVNWLPVFTGLRYGVQSPSMPSDFQSEGQGPLDLENVSFIWKDFQKKGCITMMNDDPMHYTRGLFHYPWEQAVGFRVQPTDHYFRPWHVYQRQWPANDSTYFCFNNEPYYKLQLNLVEQMVHYYKETCHFSFSFFTDITHDDPNNLELMDETMASFLERSYTNGYLNNTVLILMGDHGHRISAIQYTYIGRIEERAPFLGIYFPEWFRRSHPKIMENLKRNMYRLTSNYDVYKMLKDILNSKFDGVPNTDDTGGRLKGQSLFEIIPVDRTCQQANVPEHHCLCMETADKDRKLNVRILEWSMAIIRNYTVERLKLFPKCTSLLDVKILNLTILTTSQMIQHGIRNQLPEYMNRLNTPITGRIEYLELEYQLFPSNVTALIRLQYDKWFTTLSVNVAPLPSNKTIEYCSNWIDIVYFCACVAMTTKT